MDYKHYLHKRNSLRLVGRSTEPVYKGKFVLTTDVTELGGLSRMRDIMKRVADEHPFSWSLHMHTRTFTPRDVVRWVPSILASFNRSRLLRRANISGIRICNLYSRGNAFFYATDIVTCSAFEALSFAFPLASLLKLPQVYIVSFAPLIDAKNPLKLPNKDAINHEHRRLLELFWQRSGLPRRLCNITQSYGEGLDLGVNWVLETKDTYVISTLMDCMRSEIEYIGFGRKGLLTLSPSPCVDESFYHHSQADKVAAGVRFRRFGAFGKFYNNPEYLIYQQ